MKDFLSILRSSQLFSGISENELTSMLSCLGTRKEDFPKKAFVLRAGDTVGSIGIVLSGSVLIIQEDIWGNWNILSKAGPGQTFAAVYACAPGSRLNVSVIAETPVTVMFLNVKRILNVCPSACSHHSRVILSVNLPRKICGLTKNSRIWDSVPRGQRSCPTFPQKHSDSENTNLTFLFQDSSLRIILALSVADCRWSLER